MKPMIKWRTKETFDMSERDQNNIGANSKAMNRECDLYDFIAAGACGALGGIIDIFLVGSPVDDQSKLEPWANDKVDKAVQKFAKLTGWNEQNEDNLDVAHAINYLEQKFKVNYDQAHSSDVGYLFDMNTRDHHMKSLGHSPDLVGLFFSILNQFTSTATFVSDGKLITIKTDQFDTGKVELLGHDVKSKLFCGVANWIGHVFSDIAGSSITRRYSGDGMGVAIPFFELFQFCKIGNFDVNGASKDLAEISIEVFEQGYDARFGIALAIPVFITDLATRLVWAIRRRFQFKVELKHCIPSKRYDDLRVMLLVSSGTLCLFDGADAFIRSGGGKNAIELFSRLNYIAWARFVGLGIRELAIRGSLERDIEAVKETREAIAAYTEQLKELDVEGFSRQADVASSIAEEISKADSQEALNQELLALYEQVCDGKLPWSGSFDEHMSDPTKSLHFES